MTTEQVDPKPPKPNAQFNLYCPNCHKWTKQAHIEDADYYCTICCEVHTLQLPDTSETLKSIVEVMSRGQRVDQKICGGRR
jgi:hypothetical protein